jgi:hypothetical protein
VQEKDGYKFDSGLQKLRTTNGRPVELALNSTCHRVAAEIDGYALIANEIHFTTLSHVPGRIDEYSTASLYYQLLEKRGMLFRGMLSLAHGLVTPEITQALQSMYPGNITVSKLNQILVEDGNSFLKSGDLPNFKILDCLVEDVILHDLLQLLAVHPEFERLTSSE